MSILKDRFYWKQLNTDALSLYLKKKKKIRLHGMNTVTWYITKNDILIGTI